MKATWENTVVAESNQTVVVEGNHYFPPDSIKKDCFPPSDTHSTCPWKGIASYYHVQVGDKSIKMPRGSIPNPRRRPSRSKTTSRSGAA